MNFIKKYIESLGKISTIKKTLLGKLLKNNIILIDVGSTGGIEEKWKEIEKFLHVITFDPDPRAKTPNTKGKFENYKIGLWSKKDKKDLFLKAYSQASTFFELNEKVMSSYLNYPCHKNINKINFNVDKIENILPTNISPDFIKVDAEGADLEILRGSLKYLSKSCLGIQCEVSFINRHKKAPYFSEIDEFLRSFDFTLMKLETERWIRKNNIFSYDSNPQIIWGNAIYVLFIDSFLKKIKPFSEENRLEEFSKFLAILLIHKFYDYAYELCEKAFNENLLSKNSYLKFLDLIKRSIPSNFTCYSKSIFSILISIIVLFIFFIFPTKRKKALDFFKSKIRNFGNLLLNTRYGPYKGCV